MPKNLVIVESPAKAKTIEGYLGKDFIVKSSYGHVRDLSERGLSIDIENNFEPEYEVSEDKRKVVADLKKLAKDAEMVWLASDEDREGEAIAWHLFQSLGLKEDKTRRIVFNEITKKAISNAIEKPRGINYDLVNAQQARRILDRLVGYELSPVLWKKVKPSLSAGRVQSVAVRLIVERERERNAFRTQSFFRVTGSFLPGGQQRSFKAELNKRFEESAGAHTFLEACKGKKFKVHNVETKPATKSPSAPFTTSTLQQEASRKLGFSVARTMQVAQKLYESGKITYMRTDSVNMSDFALEASEAAIIKLYGADYHFRRKFSTKSKGAQEAHECIRPTEMAVPSAGADNSEQRLYDLIWKRSIASQMSDARLEKTTINIDTPQTGFQFVAKGEVIRFEGFLKVYLESSDEDEDEEKEEQTLPAVKAGQELEYTELTATERYTQPPARYTEASLVKKLEELGIGRPSTYAPTISTVQKRGYVEKGERDGMPRNYGVLTLKGTTLKEEVKTETTGAEKNKLFPTDIGSLVTDFLVEHFKSILDYNFTASVEKEFDEIAEGNMEWQKMIRGFYEPFHKTVETTTETAERAKGERELGVDPVSGKKITTRLGRFGPIVQIGETTEEEKARFASLRKDQSIETITLEDALELFKLPLTLGEIDGNEVSVNIGRFGPYVKYGEQFISIPKGEDPFHVDLARATEIIRMKQVEDAPIGFYDEKPITKGKGRFGPFIKWNDLFINIPRAYDFDSLTQKDCNELIAKKLEKEANRFIQQWPEEKIAIENGRWGPFIRFGKKMLKLAPKEDKSKYAPEELAALDLDAVKKMIEAQEPGAFDAKPAKKKKAAGTAKKAAKTATLKPAGKTVSKAASRKPAAKTVKKAAPKKKK